MFAAELLKLSVPQNVCLCLALMTLATYTDFPTIYSCSDSLRILATRRIKGNWSKEIIHDPPVTCPKAKTKYQNVIGLSNYFDLTF